jgi:hypothetical protein
MRTAVRHRADLAAMSEQADLLASRRPYTQKLTLGNVVDVGNGMEIGIRQRAATR